VKVATWNVNSLTARWLRVEEWLVATAPDVLLIQETKQNDAKFPFASLKELGYEAAHYGQGQWNGVAILSKVGIEDVVRGFGDDDPEARFMGATCGGVRVYSCYVPNGRALDDPHYVYKLKWLARLRDLLEQRDRSMHIVVGGDFNVAPSDLDCYDPSVFEGATPCGRSKRPAWSTSRGPYIPMSKSSRGGTIATDRFIGTGVCGSIFFWLTPNCSRSRQRPTSTAKRARAKNPRTTCRWWLTSRSR
jgi:exodeoxyribonuclease-3